MQTLKDFGFKRVKKKKTYFFKTQSRNIKHGIWRVYCSEEIQAAIDYIASNLVPIRFTGANEYNLRGVDAI